MLDQARLVQSAAHLRRAHRRHPLDADLLRVRVDLERAAGPTVGRAASARLLGVSQTALDRWVALGAIPTVTTPNNRREVPLVPLLDLFDAVERRRGERHPLAAILRARASAPGRPARGTPSGHRTAEQRGLAYHRAVARRLDDAVVADALARLRRWREDGRIHPRYADEWEALLTGSRARLRATITADDDHAAALRQSSPLAGLLSDSERRRVLGLA